MRSQRALEMLPGITAWTIIFFPLWGALIIPEVVAYFTIIFLVFWFYRSFQSAFLGIKGYFKIRQSEKTDWHQLYQQKKRPDSPAWHQIKHLIIIPNHNESVSKITHSLQHLVNQQGVDRHNLAVVLAMEERVPDAHQRAQALVEKFQGQFGQLFVTYHPSNIAGEIKGKASNEAWAAKEIKKKLVDELGWPIEMITISSCDADACFHTKYFAALTYAFALNPHRYLRFWQSPIFWHNNYWRVPAFIRIVGTMGNIIHLAHLQEPDHIIFNYSTYSTSLKLLDDVGYWDTDIIPEDWHIFLQAFFAKKGLVEVEPLFLPTCIDAPEGRNYFHALKSRYEQCKRHAWGATDIPYAFRQALKHPEIPLAARFFRLFKLLETHLIWSTNWFILTLGAWLPTLVNPVFRQTSLGYNLPKISQMILTLCLITLLVVIILDWSLRPKRPKDVSRWFVVAEVFQWLLMPIATLFMSVLPGLDSQTRLLLGKRLEYHVTDKI
ncbi:MAG: hypothetical protein ABH807_01935 [Candidatus Shapirobacteria bacterium]